MRGHSASKTRVNALTTRASIEKIFAFKKWIAGSSPAMTRRGPWYSRDRYFFSPIPANFFWNRDSRPPRSSSCC